MIDLLITNKPKIETICRNLHIHRLEVFGSASNGRFDPSRSDLDFIVEFDNSDSGLLDRYLALATQLERLLGREVDLLTAKSIRNSYFQKKVDESRALIYEDRTGQISA
jgi:predicted nucleotidyltransferase